MHELSYQERAIWKRTFNLAWDNTSGKTENQKDGLAESYSEVEENEGGCLIQGFLPNAYIKNSNKN